jgi:tungsten-dependent benzoyl-CoA reductase-related protein bamH
MNREVEIMPKTNSPTELEDLRREILSKRDSNKPCIAICAGTGCIANGAQRVIDAFKEEVKKQGLEANVDIRETGCPGFCEKGPVVVIYPEGVCYLQVQSEDSFEIISAIKERKIIERLLYTDPSTGEKVIYEHEIPFYKNQMRLLLGNNTKIDPKNIDDYIALGGYGALSKALSEMTPEQVLEEVKRSNLRGRGGAGFPAGRKWETTRNAPGEPKYVIVNCDEGDPGAFMDRALMEGNPHSVIEGLIIGAYAIGSHEGFIYVRQEYPLAVENVNIAIKRAEEYGLLGNNILGSGFDFKIKVHRGAGAFVSGESTALMSAIEGKVGEPYPSYIYPAESGVWDKPSDLNNVETWANVPLIIDKGSDWFTSIGTERSKGTKIFSLVGKVNNTGLVEVPMGTTPREIIYDIGGGIPEGKKFKAVQTGGPSGGCIPEEYLDTPVDFEELAKLGSIMGSGGIVVMDEDTCMVDVSRYFIEFLCDESCGKCVPCREGLKGVRKILNDIVAGRGKEGDIELLEEIGDVMSEASLCALGKTAANPILSTIRYFRDEYEAHIKEKRCPALVCKDLISYYIDPERCNACRLCLKNCPADAIDGEKKLIHIIDQSKCVKCGTCFDVCPPKFSAVKKISGEPVPPPIPEEKRVLVKDEKSKGGQK